MNAVDGHELSTAHTWTIYIGNYFVDKPPTDLQLGRCDLAVVEDVRTRRVRMC